MSRQKNLKRNLLICLLAGSAVMYTLPLHAATSVVANNALPENGHFVNDKLGTILKNPNNSLEMNITQSVNNAVITWDKFDVGGSATVNFKGPESGYNTLNYVNAGGSMSQIYGTINANNNGNIFIVNPAGVQIGNSAQINVGSLYVSNSKLTDDALKAVDANNINFDFNAYMKDNGAHTDAALMSLGNINANKVTFEGDGRIVIDSERIKTAAGDDKLGYQNINIKTADDNTGNVIIGYEAYDETNKSYAGANGNSEKDRIATINGNDYITKADGYMWVEDVEQLQAIDTNLSGNYALRNSIDATATENWNDNNGFSSIGVDENGKTNGVGFTGNFDGIDYNIFGLTINRSDETNVGLFGAATNANINNVTLVGGKIIGGTDVGAIVGAAEMTNISNVTNSAKVEGNNSVGGIVGVADATTVENAINTGAVEAKGNDIGGLIGSMTDTNITDNKKSELIGNSYNLGDVSSEGHNVGGLVGHAVNSTIGDGTNLVYNRMDVTGAYNVGGIVGNMVGSTVQNAENSGTVEATGYTTEDYIYHTANTNFDNAYGENGDGIGGVKVNVANVGGIVGTSSASNGKASQIKNVTNTANVSSNTGTYNQYGTRNEYYTAGNVGGIIGCAEDTDITNATNQENEIRGAHNVGGVAGYFGGSGTVSGGINDGGDIMATGARAADEVSGVVVNDAGFAQEHVRTSTVGSETFIIGNMGGVVGYMDGDNVYVTGSANRGTVHSQDINNPNQVLNISQAANTGGVVGKIDRNKINDEDGKILTNEDILAGIKDGSIKAAVTDSYNTGDVRGYTGVGGVIGMMYNGEVADSYNLGNINTTRQPVNLSNRDSVNMGGVVGDTTEGSGASAVIYNVYNKGQIGDENYETYARHVGGIVGRLSGIVDKSYNTGAIYNGYSVVGGIAGWFYEGTISNSFNTGNITVYNKETYKSGSQVGGIAGGMSAYSNSVTNAIYNAYNLGTLRSFNTNNTNNPNYIGGIVGRFEGGNNGANTNIEIKNVYTTSNIYSSSGTGAGSIYGSTNIGNYLNIQGANYIELDNDNFTNLKNTNNGVNKIDYDERYNSSAYNFVAINNNDKIWADVNGAIVSEAGYWRIYKNDDGTIGSTPILNAFLPNAENYFSQSGNMNGISSIQYGTAYDPLLTIINAASGTNNLNYDWSDLGISNAAGIAVYGAGLILENVNTSGGSGYFGGTIYADGALNLNSYNDIGLGSAADIYGSAVNITTDGKVTIYGSVTATGNEGASNINITASDVNVYGTLNSVADSGNTKVTGILGSAVNQFDFGNISDKDEAATSIGDRFAKTVKSQGTGNITITAKGTRADVDGDGKIEADEVTGGNVGLYYGNKGEGITTTGGDLTVTGTGDVYVDSDLDIGGDLKLDGTGAESEVVLDITNIGEVQEKNNNNDADNSTEYLHDFLNHFANNGNIVLTSASGDAKLAVDMWDETLNNNQGAYNLNKFNYNGQTFVNKLNNLNFNVNGVSQKDDASNFTYIWVSTAEQLQGIQDYYNAHKNDSDGTGALTYNYALKNDINASDLTDYEAIGTGATDGFTGTFDGRGNRIIGLDATQTKNGNDNQVLTNAGIFSTVGDGGTVKNLNVYSGTFTGSSTAGAIAGINNGTIENITAFGNTVTVTSDSGNAGGIAGTNSGTVDDVESSGSVIGEGANAIVGGLVGTNESGATVNNSYSKSAVTSTSGTDADLGGVVGVNEGTVSLVDSLGVTNGTNSTNVGGVIGINSGTLNSAYNESIVNGNSNVGGIIGKNDGGSNYIEKEDGTVTWSKGTVENVVNATGVTGTGDYVGGLVGTNIGSVENGRNNGTITGNTNVGGLVGNNASENSVLTNLVNDSSASIIGVKYVGGIAGSNAGTITTGNEETDETVNLINRGTITGQKYVGGVAGINSGTITNANNDVELNVKNKNQTAQYFGGIAGENTGTINNATNSADVNADGATYVGGIVGYNTKDGKLQGMGNSNEGRVEGASYVGGVIGYNEADIGSDSEDIVEIKNSGTVVANDGGAGGIIGVNNGNVTNANLISEGVVTGTDSTTGETGTGGIFGINNGDITNSTLENTNGTITGVDNTGGLIGINNGKIQYSSLKNTADITVKDDGSNIGGLIGKNTGVIEGGRKDVNGTDAGYYKYQVYNNGTITVTGSGTNIGGLIGNNAKETINGVEQTGSLTAGYNTGAINAGSSSNVGGIVGNNAGKVDQVFNTVMTPEGEGAITGGNNVGGLVGTNSGTLSNAYNTTEVTSTNSGVVGNAVGENSGTITNIYASNIIGNLIGTGYDNGKVTNAYSFATGDSTATKVLTDESVQKAEESYGFDNKNDGTTWKFYDGYSNPLLKVFLTTLTVDSDQVDLVYNAGEQDLNIGELVGNVITAPIVKDGEEIIYNGLDAYYNTVINGSDLGESELLQNTMGQKDAGTYDNWLYSGQIASGSKDGSGFNPNNLGYDIVYTKNDSGETGVEIGKATINIDLGKVEHTYGNADVINGTGNFKNEAGYGFNITNSNLTQEMKDELNDKGLGFVFEKDNALTGDTSGRVTEDVKDGGYTWSANFELSEELKKNYQFDDNGSATLNKADGQSIVNQAKLEISVDDAETMPGVVPNFTGTNIQQGLVNGDVAGNYDYALDSSVDINVDDIYTDKIGISFGNSETYYDLDNVDWSTIPGWEFLKNYDINFDPGTLTVDSEIMPDLPDNWPNNRWDYLFGDNPFDRNENFRERKAEVNFVDGAMEI